MLKKEARKTYRRLREEISLQDKTKWDDLILIQLQTLQLPALHHIMNFFPLEEYNEVETATIGDFLRFRNPGACIAYPRTHAGNTSMDAVLCTPDTVFEANAWNIPEPLGSELIRPADLDLVIVPMLICDEQGNRVGYGKGFYDRFFTHCRKDVVKLGLSYFDPIDRIDDADEFDVPLNYCITPRQVYVF